MKNFAPILFFAVIFSGCTTNSDLETVPKVDIKRYSGKWYEIARYPNRFQRGCVCSSAEYEPMRDGTIRVTNRCAKKNKHKEAVGKAWVVEGSGNAKLKVQFQWPFRGDYWIIELDEDYNYAVVSDPKRKYLWILCRNRRMDEALYNEILMRLTQKGFDKEKLIQNKTACK